MKQTRIVSLDYLRAFSIVIVIVTHVLSRNLGPDLINTVWNFLHFVVPLFVLCSGYVMYRQQTHTEMNSRSLLPWFLKRAERLVLPYYAYLALHYVLWFMFPALFSGYGLSTSLQFIASSLLFVGVDFGWLPLLFLELMILTPLYLKLLSTSRLRIVGIFIGFLISLIFVFTRVTVDYRFVMWIPWSVIYLLSFEAAHRKLFEDNHALHIPLLLIAVVFGMLFVILTKTLSGYGTPLTLTVHKYPPDAYYLSYSLSIGSMVTLVLSRMHDLPLVTWLSREAYALYFAHYIAFDILYFFRSRYQISLLGQLLFVFMLSIGLVWLLGKLYQRFMQLNKTIPL